MLCTVRDLFSCEISLCTSLCGEASHCLSDEDVVMWVLCTTEYFVPGWKVLFLIQILYNLLKFSHVAYNLQYSRVLYLLLIP